MRRTFNICQKNGSDQIARIGINRYCSETKQIGSSIKRLIRISDIASKKMSTERKMRRDEHYKNVNEKLNILESKFMNNDFESNMERMASYGDRKVHFNFKANEFCNFHNVVGEKICPSMAVRMMIQRWILKNPNWKGLDFHIQPFCVGSDEVRGFFYY